MIFSIDKTTGDTCGNEEDTGETTYLEADNAIHAWRKLKSPRVHTYWIGKKSIYFERTPKGRGFGIWEDNPEFNWERDMHKVTAFVFGGDGFGRVYVNPIKVRK